MILEALKKIQAFGGPLRSTLTPKDLDEKEAELGFPLPEALRELYLTFHPDDRIFSGKMHLIPLQMLKSCQRVCWSDTILTLLPFCCDEKYGYAFEVNQYCKKTDKLQVIDPEDPQIWALFTSPETAKEKKYLNGCDVPCNKSQLSRWIVEWLGYEQTQAQPSVVAVNKDKMDHYWELRKVFSRSFCSILPEQQAGTRKNFIVEYTEEPTRLLHATILYSDLGYFGAQTDEELEALMKQLNFRYVWIKSQSGHAVINSAPPEPPKERALLPITPALEFLRQFAGISQTGAKEESIQRAETRLGAPLPLSLREFYRCLPSSFYHSYNNVRPLSALKKTKDGKLNFLEENQAVCHWAAELGSPFLYQRCNDGAGEWIAFGILDGFLAAEFLWALACKEDLEMNLWEFPDFEPSMLEPGGQLEPHLSPIAEITDQIAIGNTRKLYQAINGQAVGLYDEREQTFWFVTKNEAAEEQLERELGFPPSIE